MPSDRCGESLAHNTNTFAYTRRVDHPHSGHNARRLRTRVMTSNLRLVRRRVFQDRITVSPHGDTRAGATTTTIADAGTTTVGPPLNPSPTRPLAWATAHPTPIR